jgi:hypothetical protein
LTFALALALAGVLALRLTRPVFPAQERWLVLATMAAIGWQILALSSTAPGMYLRGDANLGAFKALIATEAVLTGLGAARVRALARAWFPLLLLTHLAAGVWMLRASPDPRIDVVVVHREAFVALGEGRSPYRISFENIYGTDSGFYNRDLVAGQRVLFGYPYPPLSLILAAPGHLVAGDYRYSQLVALVAAAALIGFAQSSLFPKLVAALLLTQPRGLFVLEQGWTEPIVLLMLALSLFVMSRKPSASGWMLGLLVVTKQYLALAGPPIWRYARSRPAPWGVVLRAALAAAIVTLPFLLWHPRSFVDSVLLLQAREPFRIDSLSYLSWAARQEWGAGTFVWAVAAGSIGLAIAMTAAPNSPLGLAASLALSTFAMFAFGSKAFCNYYYFVAGALCCAAALEPQTDTTSSGSAPETSFARPASAA